MRPLAVAAALLLAGAAVAQPAPGGFDALKASGDITNQLARRDIDGASQEAAALMEGPTASKMKEVFQVVRGLGQGQYADLVYARDYGRTEKDIIYKVDFEKAFLFVRFLYHVDNGAWRLIHVNVKMENDEAFPKEWVHIYPR
ncbi:MAG TPA: hypothetical protein VHY82_08830 [Acetobacteraceae bacterium]|nr:hypothetical protein [Acetobacteraceae bacterium]